MIKKSIIILFCIIFILPLIMAQNKIEVSTLKETFKAGELITLKVSLFDASNNPINDQVNIVLEDAEKRIKIEDTIQSNQFVDIELPEEATHGYWEVIVKYGEDEAKTLFVVEISELAEFSLEGDILTITNIGNTKYTKTVQIIIGDTVGIKEPKLNIGDSIEYRLIAPDGNYNIRVTDGKASLERGNVALTGRVIGVLDESVGKGVPLTGGIKSGDIENQGIFKNTFVYVFVLVIFGAMILLAIERLYRKKID